MRCSILFVLLTMWQAGSSQSFFYNTQHFGLQSTLLGGAVTAGSEDLSMVYYNPAALRYAKGKGFDVAIFMPTLSINNYGDFFNSDQDLKSTQLMLNPNLITYKTTIKDFSLVFSILQKDVWDNEISYNEIKTIDIFDKNESFHYRYKGDEKWFGLGTHFVISDVVSLGISHFWNAQSTRYRYHINTEIVNKSGLQLGYFNQNLSLDYSVLFAAVTKFGLSLDFVNDRAGLVITTPYYRPFRLDASFERTTSELDRGDYFLENIVDFDLEPTLKSGWQIDLGYAKIFPDSSEIWFNASVHTGVQEHNALGIERIQNDPLHFSRGVDPIVNFSIGHTRYIGPNIQLIGSLRTNISAYPNKQPVLDSENVIVLEANRLHLAMGSKVRHKNSSFVLGLDWGFTFDGELDQFQRFPNIDQFDTQPASYGHQSLTFLLTYEFLLDSVGQQISRMVDREK